MLFCSLFPLVLLFKKDKNIDDNYSNKYHIFHLSLTIILCVGSIFLINKPKNPEILPFIDYLDSLVENKENIKLYTDYLDGSYAEFRGYYCYIDPRGEIFLKTNNNKEDIYEEFDNLSKLVVNYKEFIDKYNFDYMLVNKESTMGYLMKDDSYKYTVIKENNTHTLYKLNEE